MPQTNTYNPEEWLESMTRALKEYTVDGFNNSVLDDALAPAGNLIYDVVMEFPSTDYILREVPDPKTIISFEIDDISNFMLGFGENVAKRVYNDIDFEVVEQEGRRQEIDFDVGIWASDKAGGLTARLRAYQTLVNLFSGSMAITNLREATNAGDGALEIIKFDGGRFAVEAINDVRIFRLIGCSLVIRVFSRTPNPIITPTIEDLSQDQTEIVLDPHIP